MHCCGNIHCRYFITCDLFFLRWTVRGRLVDVSTLDIVIYCRRYFVDVVASYRYVMLPCVVSQTLFHLWLLVTCATCLRVFGGIVWAFSRYACLFRWHICYYLCSHFSMECLILLLPWSLVTVIFSDVAYSLQYVPSRWTGAVARSLVSLVGGVVYVLGTLFYVLFTVGAFVRRSLLFVTWSSFLVVLWLLWTISLLMFPFIAFGPSLNSFFPCFLYFVIVPNLNFYVVRYFTFLRGEVHSFDSAGEHFPFTGISTFSCYSPHYFPVYGMRCRVNLVFGDMLFLWCPTGDTILVDAFHLFIPFLLLSVAERTGCLLRRCTFLPRWVVIVLIVDAFDHLFIPCCLDPTLPCSFFLVSYILVRPGVLGDFR